MLMAHMTTSSQLILSSNEEDTFGHTNETKTSSSSAASDRGPDKEANSNYRSNKQDGHTAPKGQVSVDSDEKKAANSSRNTSMTPAQRDTSIPSQAQSIVASSTASEAKEIKFRVSAENVAKNKAMQQVSKEPMGPSSFVKGFRLNNNCRNCGKRGAGGNKDTGDNCFYCDACWETRLATFEKSNQSVDPDSKPMDSATNKQPTDNSEVLTPSIPANHISVSESPATQSPPPIVPLEGSRSHRSGTLPPSLSELWHASSRARASSTTFNALEDGGNEDDEDTYVNARETNKSQKRPTVIDENFRVDDEEIIPMNHSTSSISVYQRQQILSQAEGAAALLLASSSTVLNNNNAVNMNKKSSIITANKAIQSDPSVVVLTAAAHETLLKEIAHYQKQLAALQAHVVTLKASANASGGDGMKSSHQHQKSSLGLPSTTTSPTQQYLPQASNLSTSGLVGGHLNLTLDDENYEASTVGSIPPLQPFKPHATAESIDKNRRLQTVSVAKVAPSSFVKGPRLNNNCRECGRRGAAGHKDTGDECFYCDVCWIVRLQRFDDPIGSGGPSQYFVDNNNQSRSNNSRGSQGGLGSFGFSNNNNNVSYNNNNSSQNFQKTPPTNAFQNFHPEAGFGSGNLRQSSQSNGTSGGGNSPSHFSHTPHHPLQSPSQQLPQRRPPPLQNTNFSNHNHSSSFGQSPNVNVALSEYQHNNSQYGHVGGGGGGGSGVYSQNHSNQNNPISSIYNNNNNNNGHSSSYSQPQKGTNPQLHHHQHSASNSCNSSFAHHHQQNLRMRGNSGVGLYANNSNDYSYPTAAAGGSGNPSNSANNGLTSPNNTNQSSTAISSQHNPYGQTLFRAHTPTTTQNGTGASTTPQTLQQNLKLSTPTSPGRGDMVPPPPPPQSARNNSLSSTPAAGNINVIQTPPRKRTFVKDVISPDGSTSLIGICVACSSDDVVVFRDEGNQQLYCVGCWSLGNPKNENVSSNSTIAAIANSTQQLKRKKMHPKSNLSVATDDSSLATTSIRGENVLSASKTKNPPSKAKTEMTLEALRHRNASVEARLGSKRNSDNENESSMRNNQAGSEGEDDDLSAATAAAAERRRKRLQDDEEKASSVFERSSHNSRRTPLHGGTPQHQNALIKSVQARTQQNGRAPSFRSVTTATNDEASFEAEVEHQSSTTASTTATTRAARLAKGLGMMGSKKRTGMTDIPLPSGPPSFVRGERINNNCVRCNVKSTAGFRDTGDDLFYCDDCWEDRLEASMMTALEQGGGILPPEERTQEHVTVAKTKTKKPSQLSSNGSSSFKMGGGGGGGSPASSSSPNALNATNSTVLGNKALAPPTHFTTEAPNHTAIMRPRTFIKGDRRNLNCTHCRTKCTPGNLDTGNKLFYCDSCWSF